MTGEENRLALLQQHHRKLKRMIERSRESIERCQTALAQIEEQIIAIEIERDCPVGMSWAHDPPLPDAFFDNPDNFVTPDPAWERR